MDSSSENSFAWTDTTSDSFQSINSTPMSADEINGNSINNFCTNDEKKTKHKKSRKKNHDESVSLETNVVIKEEKYFEPKINSSVKKKNIKIEQDSENEVQRKKKKIRNFETNGDQNDSQESMSFDETFLNMKVKQEDSSTSCTTKHKKKKRKRTSSIDSSTSPLRSYENNCSTEINVILKEETENHTEVSNIKKKKKKSKKRHNSGNQHLDVEETIDIEETMDIEETVVNHNSKGNYTDSFITEKTLQEESSCDEISAIKCDDSHSPHTISFINNNEENTKVKYNNSLNISTKLADSVPEQESNKKLNAATHRKQRISDRIRFEDDTSTESSHIDHESNSEKNKKALKLQNFIKTNPNLKLLPHTFNNNTNLTQDDEVWILKCPKEINIKDFDNTTLNIHGKCKIKVAGQTYEGSAEEEQSDTISLLTMDQNKYRIRNIPLSGIINLRKRIPKAHFRDDNIMVNNQTNFIPLPETKCRHPLFGSNYKKALKIPAAIAERLNVQDTEDTAKRKKKKGKKERNALAQVDAQAQIDITMKTEPELPVETGEKKKKKRKMIDDELSAPKKAKRIKHDPDSAEAWESEKAIEENLFNF